MMRHLLFSEKTPGKTDPSTELMKTAGVVAGVLSHGRTCSLLASSVPVDNVTVD